MERLVVPAAEEEPVELISQSESELGTLAIRVLVLPPKDKLVSKTYKDNEILDREEGEEFLPDKSKTPVGSYLENDRGKRCVVFLVNGQTQDFLDNSFIVNDLGFKYLRHRMIIAIDVDGLTPETIGRLMQSSRQGFFRGAAFEAIRKKIVSILKSDPDLEQLELEAESQIANLQAGDAKVKEYLDQLIQSHHDQGLHLAHGAGVSGESFEQGAGSSTPRDGNVVSLFPPNVGEQAEYPILVPQPHIVAFNLRPNAPRTILVRSAPAHAWPSLSKISVNVVDDVPELKASVLHLPDRAEFTVQFAEPTGFDPSNYPIKTKVVLTGRFDEIAEPRQVTFGVVVRRDETHVDPVLLDIPTKLLITSRQPVRLRRDRIDTHVKFRWDGKDHLLAGVTPSWNLSATLLHGPTPAPQFSFSDPVDGRFELLIRPPAEWKVGAKATVQVEARGPNDAGFQIAFECEVVDAPARPDPPEPRLVEGKFPSGANRRPPYELIYITEENWRNGTCWGGSDWTGMEPGCYLEPTETTPLRIIINNDMTRLKTYKNLLVSDKMTEGEIERRVTKYTSHVAFHLYQMFLSARETVEPDYDAAEQRRRKEIERVAMTLIRLMEVSR